MLDWLDLLFAKPPQSWQTPQTTPKNKKPDAAENGLGEALVGTYAAIYLKSVYAKVSKEGQILGEIGKALGLLNTTLYVLLYPRAVFQDLRRQLVPL